MHVELVRHEGLGAYDRYVRAHRWALPYQYSYFAMAVNQAYGFDSFFLAAKTGARIRGVLGLSLVRVPGRPGQLVSLPYCDAAGILADDEDTQKMLLARGLDLAKELKVSRLSIRSTRPFAGIDPELTCHGGKVRLLLPLGTSSSALMASLKSKVRSQVKKPLRQGLYARIGGRELLHAFFEVFAVNMRDLGSPAHALTWFEAVLSHYGNLAHIGGVFLPDGRPAACGIILCHPNGNVSIPWASSLRRFNPMNPNMLLYWQFLAFASDRGFSTFDFGRSAPGGGTFRFKTQWGAVPSPLHWADFDPADPGIRPIPVKFSGNPSWARQTAAHLISKLPVSLATFGGRYTRKYIPL